MIKLHDDIVKAIETRDSKKAIQLIEAHYDIQIESTTTISAKGLP
jgi:DNA-binding GntR family transcriptional regulator